MLMPGEPVNKLTGVFPYFVKAWASGEAGTFTRSSIFGICWATIKPGAYTPTVRMAIAKNLAGLKKTCELRNINLLMTDVNI